MRIFQARSIVTLLFMVTSKVVADAADPVVGDMVFVKDKAETKIDAQKNSFPATVEDVDGDLLWLGRSWVHKNDVMSADEALEVYDEQINRQPTNAKAWRHRGSVMAAKGEDKKAREDFSEAIQRDPSDAAAYYNRAQSWNAAGRYEDSIADFDRAIRLDPKDPFPYAGRGHAWLSTGQIVKAFADFNEAIRLDPTNGYIYGERAFAWYRTDDVKKAAGDYEAAIRLQPKWSYGYSGLAWVLATASDPKLRDGRRAVELATKAGELTNWADASVIQTLAAAYAESKEWENAVERQKQYIEMASTEHDKQVGRELLELYLKKEPYRDFLIKKPQKPVSLAQSIERNFKEVLQVGVLLVIGYVAFYFFLQYRKERRTSQQSNESRGPDAEPEPNQSSEIVTVATFRSLPEAEACKLHLESQGLTVFLNDAETVRTDWFLSNAIGFAKIQVPTAQSERAAALIEQIRARHDERSLQADDNRCLACGADIPADASQCPACGWSYAQIDKDRVGGDDHDDRVS